jgi:hypothetical protein
VAVNRDDVFLEADSISNHITSISEANAGTTGALEHLEFDATPVQTTITDDADTVTVKLKPLSRPAKTAAPSPTRPAWWTPPASR